jgi:ABC-type uncharacterized transport system permease subunit
MLQLPIAEKIVFIWIVLTYLGASIVGILQLLAGGEKYKRLLSPLVCLAVVAESALLILRAVALKAVPLTSVFESMIVLTLAFGLIYLYYSVTVRQVWFGSVMVWAILAMVILAATVAKPAAEPHAAAATFWAIAHGVAMILGGASVTFATASGFLYLLGRRKLKRKQVLQVLGKVPNIEKLEQMNLEAVRVGFVLIAVGLISGLGLALTISGPLAVGVLQWMADAKIVMIAVVWLLLAAALALRRVAGLKGKTMAWVTIVSFVLILYALVGSSVLCGSKHDFAAENAPTTEVKE